jgi:D-glycero-D-manno-heptose 1,7-bisphosphate phosphatase
MRRALFIDRDGVININLVDNVRTWDQFQFERGSLDALARPELASYVVIVITYLSGIGRGHLTEATLYEIHDRMVREIERAGGHIDKIMFCPHIPEDQCTCRKPSPEMLLHSRDEFGLDLSKSYFVGDWVDDVLAGREAGVIPLLVLTGRGEKALQEMQTRGIDLPDVVPNLAAALDRILKRDPVPVTA